MKILRINMKNLTVSEDKTMAYKGLGGRGLTSKIVHDEVPPSCHPLGSFNKLIFANGYLTGSGASSSDRYSIGAKSPLTGGIKESNAGGESGLFMGKLGIRALVFEDVRDDFKIVYISKDGVTFDDATPILGKELSEAVDILRNTYGKHIAVFLIGITGEKKMNIAAIAGQDKEKEPTRFNGRGGLGAVAGSKGIKAIVLDAEGVERNKPKDKEQFKTALKTYHKWLMETPGTAKIFPELGTAGLVKTTNALGALPTRNFSTGSFELADNISGEKLRETILERGGEGTPTHACMPGCIIRCSNVYANKAGKRVTSPVEYENIGLLGSNLGIGDLDDIAEINRLINEYGADTIETGATLGVLMSQNILSFGDAESVLNAVKEIKEGSPLGRIIGGGAELAGKLYGAYRVPTVKGQSFPAYDPRGVKSLGVTFATSPMGADHTAGQTIRAQVDHHSPEGQVKTSKLAQQVNTLFDALGMCYFSAGAVQGRFELLADLITAYTGEKMTDTKLKNIASETLRIEHDFNRKAGFTKAHDRLPEYLYYEMNEASKTVFDVPQEEVESIGVESNDR
ncbi:aldehyde ferredoxin oxidoreductase C-terminal domain-containing protein [Tepidibacillus sp. HK-1]|uniref:aldehyde ferredoxin oxidoreductase C-terminal domain-containing protein n=1 Tax=Tepidibacillus sp. HK-1 TaxID=1883407 RepID=UPI0008535E2C|nr:aldehyde ferredoxin oxidoreductase C-terminal domain-containing protein [Tepidibacillus sp. HK-1]GBF12231.1 putative oxidoreductase YdhV [Tepidibacillus sp. HK-1]